MLKSKKLSAGILAWRRDLAGTNIEVFLVHPGGPFWAKKDDGVWSVPKGEVEPDRELLAEACREFEEETGVKLAGNFMSLAEIQQKSGKRVKAWAIETNFDVNVIQSNLFEMEWPPRSGKTQSFPEVDRGAWLSLTVARKKLIAAQCALLDELECLVMNYF